MNADEMRAPKQFRTVYPALAVLLGGLLVATVLLITEPAGAAANRHLRHGTGTSGLQAQREPDAALKRVVRHHVSQLHQPQHKCPPGGSTRAPKPKPKPKKQPKPRPTPSAPPRSSAPPAAHHSTPPPPPSSTRQRASRVVVVRSTKVVVQPRAHVSVHVNQAHPTRRSGAGAAHRVESPTAAAARAGARPARLAADSDTQHAALVAAPAQAMLGAIARRQAAKASAPAAEHPAAEHPAADAVQRTAGETALPVGQPWLLAIFAIVALAAVSAASAQVVVRRKRS